VKNGILSAFRSIQNMALDWVMKKMPNVEATLQAIAERLPMDKLEEWRQRLAEGKTNDELKQILVNYTNKTITDKIMEKAQWLVGEAFERFSSSDGRFEMAFRPVLDRSADINLLVMRSVAHQVFGHFTGRAVLDDGTELEVENLFGFAEKVYNRW